MKYTAKPVEVDAGTIRQAHFDSERPQDGTWLTVDGMEEWTGPQRGFFADVTMTSRYTPVAGDYLVRQSDGYFYINPKDVFERKYTKTP